MHFYANGLFHVYNQGNKGQKVFFTEDNYRLFLWKMRAYLLPFGDLVAYCLMPNHFHWLFYVRQVEISKAFVDAQVAKMNALRMGKPLKPVTYSGVKKELNPKTTTLNNAIGVLQRSYTQFINAPSDEPGSLFRKHCKAKDGWIDEFITLKHKSGKDDYRFMPGNSYALNCLNYIHENPPEAGLVQRPEDWPYSSARDYAGLRKETLCNLELGRQIMEW